MTSEQFSEILRRGKSASVEFKRCGNQPGQDTFETICLFSNRYGASIYLGVSDDGTVIGIPEPAVLPIKRNINNVTKNDSMFDPPVTIELETITHEGKNVIRIWVPSSPVIHSFKKAVFDRVGYRQV